MKKNTAIALIVIAVLLSATIIYISFRKNINKFIQQSINEIFLKPEQETYIIQLNPVVQNKFRQFIQRVQNETGYSVILTSGYRTFAEQQKEYDANNKNAKPGYSFHNYGLAIDINATNGTNYLRKASSKQDWINSGIVKIAKEMNMRWGGDLTNYADNVHFDFGNDYSINHLYELAINQFGADPNKIEGNKINLT